MKSIRTKLIVLILCSVIVSALTVGILGVLMTAKLVTESSNENMNLQCQVCSDGLNMVFYATEDSVGMLAHYATEELESADALRDKTYRDEYILALEKNAIRHTEQAGGALAIYIRFNNEITGENAGFFRVKNEEGKFEETEITDIDLYDKDDIEHVGWWHLPKEKGEPVWLDPYYNANIDHLMFSYVVPFYKDGEMIGVVGADISVDYVIEKVKDISFYESGKAAIVEPDGTVVYHPTIETGKNIGDINEDFAGIVDEISVAGQTEKLVSYEFDGIHKKLAARNLSNGMTLLCFAPDSEIYHEQNVLIIQVAVIVVLTSVIFSVITVFIGRKMTKPIKMLNYAAKHLVDRDFNLDISKVTNDEIGELAKTFSETHQLISDRLEMLNAEAHTDALTGLGNKFAFIEKEMQINARIEEGTAKFDVAVFDVNDLKKTNDSFGHLAGDELLATVSAHLEEYFGIGSVFRLGGDEFVAIATGRHTEGFPEKVYECGIEMYNLKVNGYPEIEVSCAFGVAEYNSGTDVVFSDVLRRADREMYVHKPKNRQGSAFSEV